MRNKTAFKTNTDDERKAEKYLQILNIHYIQTHGLPGCHHGDDYRVGLMGGGGVRAWYMQWLVLGRVKYGYSGVKMPIDSSVGHH